MANETMKSNVAGGYVKTEEADQEKSLQYPVISADSHILEPPGTWVDRVAAKYKDQVPQLRHLDTHDEWVMGDVSMGGLGSAINQAGPIMQQHTGKEHARMEAKDWEALEKKILRWEQVRPGGYIPEEFLRDQEIDGVYSSVIYTSRCLGMFRQRNSPLLREIFRAYNDWIGEFCSYSPNRLKGIGLILLDDIEESIKELQRCADMKLGGIQIPTYPEPHRPYFLPEYEPFWEAAEALGMPMGMHIQSWRAQPALGTVGPAIAGFIDGASADIDPNLTAFIGDAPKELVMQRPPVDRFATTDYWVRRSVGDMIFSKVFERHPGLTVVCVEYDTGFVPYHLSRMDHTYLNFPAGAETRFKDDRLPSDFWHQNVKLTFQDDPLGMQRLRDLIGVETLMWGSDYPHRESTFPYSLQAIEKTFQGVPDHEKTMIVGGNAAKLYKID